MKILLIDDDHALINHLKPVLKADGYVVEYADNGIDAEFLGFEEEFDAIILDLGLPQKNGLDVLKAWRQNDMKAPILILTARDSWQERVDGLKAGADDYLGKPFQIEELLARLEAILRRNIGTLDNTLKYDNLTLNLNAQNLILDNNDDALQLTAIEFKLLRHLMSNPGKILSKTELSEHVYEEENLKDSNTIEVYINRLRKLIGKERIVTLRGQGYRMS
ncbi:MAG: response regulator transcription factor [Reinekea sp.]|jgi:two-component system, OmpR family, response regulator